MPDDAPRRSLLEIVALPGPQTTVSLAGELDPATAPELHARLTELAADAGVTSVVIDLSEISFLDSSGLRVLVAGNEALRARSADLVLRGPSANVRRILEVTGLADLITVES
ncbi:STAS domain-containing protein [Aquihabitans daechungensis]|uniref:STAS domain-containing protein n=1 Tax=Aquihabitans daechungensis TaxID=1052257 RepID=UPI003B9E6FDE